MEISAANPVTDCPRWAFVSRRANSIGAQAFLYALDYVDVAPAPVEVHFATFSPPISASAMRHTRVVFTTPATRGPHGRPPVNIPTRTFELS